MKINNDAIIYTFKLIFQRKLEVVAVVKV